MELLFEIIFELVVGGSIEGANDNELPKVIRIGLLIVNGKYFPAKNGN